MKKQELELLLAKYYPLFPPTQFPGADQHKYAELVRSAISEAAGSGASPVNVLDFGCGRGAVELYNYRAENVRVCGVDVDEAAMDNPYLDEAKVITDGIDYPDNTFDIICSAHVFEHIPDPIASFTELYRVLKPGGKLIALTPNAHSFPAIVAKLTPEKFHVWLNAKRGRAEHDTFPTVYKLNTITSIASAAKRAGFAIEKLEYWEGRPEYFFFAKPVFYIGLFWERIVNALPFLASFRTSLFIILSK